MDKKNKKIVKKIALFIKSSAIYTMKDENN